MTRYLVTLRYRTPRDRPGIWTMRAVAEDADQARAIAVRSLRRRPAGHAYRLVEASAMPADAMPSSGQISGRFDDIGRD